MGRYDKLKKELGVSSNTQQSSQTKVTPTVTSRYDKLKEELFNPKSEPKPEPKLEPKKEVKKQSFVDKLLPDKELEKGRKAVLDVFSPKTVKGAIKEIAKAPDLLKKANERFGQSLRKATGTSILEDYKNPELIGKDNKSLKLKEKTSTGSKKIDQALDQSAFVASLAAPLPGAEAMTFASGASKVGTAFKKGKIPTTTVKKPLLSLPSKQFEAQQALKNQPLALPSKQQQFIDKVASQGAKTDEVVKPFGETPKPLPQTGTVSWTKEGTPIFGLPEGTPLVQKSDAIPMGNADEVLGLPLGRRLGGTKATRGRTARGILVDNVQATMAIGKKLGYDPQKDYGKFQEIYKKVSGVKGDYLQKAVETIAQPTKERTIPGILKGLQRGRESQRMREIVGLNPLARPSAELFPENYIPPSSVSVATNGLKTQRGVSNRLARTMQNRESQAFADRLRAEQQIPQTEFSGMTGVRDSIRVTGKLPSVVKMADSGLSDAEKLQNAIKEKSMFRDFSPLSQTPTREPLTPQNMAGMREAIPQPQNRVELRGQLPKSPIPRPTTKRVVEPKVEVSTQQPKTSITEYSNLKRTISDTDNLIGKNSRELQKTLKAIEEKGETPQRLEKVSRLQSEIQSLTEQNQLAKQSFGKLKTTDFDIADNEYTRENVKNLVEGVLKNTNPNELPEKTPFYYYTTDVFRIFDKVFGKEKNGKGNVLVRNVLDKFDDSKGKMAQFQIDELKSLGKNVVDKYNIQPGSKLSAAVQDFGERKIASVDELKAQFPNDYKKIIAAERYLRGKYDEFIDTANEQIRMIYGSDTDKIIKKREDYFHHFNDLTGISGIRNLMDSISGKMQRFLPEYAKPKLKKQGYMMERKGGKYTSDAIGGFIKYLPDVAYTIHIDKHTQVFRELANQLKQANGGEATALTNYLDEYSNVLSGLPVGMDRALGKIAGQNVLSNVRKVTNTVKSNAILGNISSAIGQLGNLPNAIGSNGVRNTYKGFKRMVEGTFDDVVNQSKNSNFLKERMIGKQYREFDRKLTQQPRKMAEWLLESFDEVGSKIAWNGAYEKALSEGISDPIRYADKEARKLLAGRGVGEVPLLQNETLFQTLMPFQLEVMNQWKVYGEKLGEKEFGALIKMLIAGYLVNETAEQIRGSRVSMDMVNAVKDASQPGLSVPQRIGRVAGEVVSNIPGGAYVADTIVPETGLKVGGETLTRKELFGQQDPTRFGTDAIIVAPIKKAGQAAVKGDYLGASKELIFAFLTPFGGSQIKKTLEGAETISKGGRFKNDKLYYPVERTPSNIAKSLLFGSSVTPEGKAFYNAPGVPRPLSVEQTKQALSSDNVAQSYTDIRQQGKIKNLFLEATKVKNRKGKYANFNQNQVDLELAKIQKEIDKLTK